MVKEFSVLVHLMEKGFRPRDSGAGWFIEQPDPVTGALEQVEVDRMAISQAKRFDCIEIMREGAAQVAVLKEDPRKAESREFAVPNADLSNLSCPERLGAIEATGLEESPHEEDYDRLTRLASSVLKCPVSTISIVSDTQQWFKSHVGLTSELASERRTDAGNSLCKYVASSGAEFVVADAQTHPLTKDLEIVRDLDIRAYAGYPIYSLERECVGAFCVMDHKPRHWTTTELELLKQFADLATNCISSHEVRLQLAHENQALRHKPSRRGTD